MMSTASHDLQSLGYAGPFPLLDRHACRSLLARLRAAPPPLHWHKGHAATSRAFYEIGAHPDVVGLLQQLVDHDLMLWGASLVQRAPDQLHGWHTDLEAHLAGEDTINVWLGLEHTTEASSLRLIPGSHRYRQIVEEHEASHGAADDESAFRWARTHDPQARIVQTALRDGQLLIFRGRLWHASTNMSPKTRTAVLLQYARPAAPIREPASYVGWPIHARAGEPPPCVMVSGTVVPGSNRLVSPPPPEGASEIAKGFAARLELPLPDGGDGWRQQRVSKGPQTCAPLFTAHASTLEPGHTPHEPHVHVEEEVLVVLDGRAQLTLGEVDARRRFPVGPGDLAYYPARHPHTLTCGEEGPVTYLMFRWWGDDVVETQARLEPQVRLTGEVLDRLVGTTDRNGLRTERLFEGPTAYLPRLHAHASVLAPGQGYQPHVDPYDLAIVVLDGEVTTDEGTFGRGSVVFRAAGQEHGLRNRARDPARYIVIEFHPSYRAAPEPSLARRIGRRVLPVPVKRWAKEALGLRELP